MDTERTLAPSPFPEDDGQAAGLTRLALAEASGSTSPAAYFRAVAALCLDRVLVPVVATATRIDRSAGGVVGDKEAEMSVVGLETVDGSRAMLAFTGLDTLTAWQAQARPVPVTLDVAAQAALADGAVTLLVDFGSRHPLVIENELLGQLAAGHRLVELSDGFGWAVTQTAAE